MKKLIIIAIAMLFFTRVGNGQQSLFVGLNAQPLYISGGVELTANLFKKAGLFVRPTYNRRPYNNRTSPISYIDIPIGVKFLIVDVPARGSAVNYFIDFSVGPYIGYAFKGKYTPSSGTTSKAMSFGSGATDQFDVMDFGYFLNTQLNMGIIGFGVSVQVGTKQHDMSKLGLFASSTKQKAGTQFQITMNVNLVKRANKK